MNTNARKAINVGVIFMRTDYTREPQFSNFHDRDRFFNQMTRSIGAYQIGRVILARHRTITSDQFMADSAESTQIMREWMNKDKINLFVLVLDKKSPKAYSLFKDITDRTLGVQSSCLVFRLTGLDQYFGNVMMKMNLKFGGVNHTVATLKTGKPKLDNTLILGA